jgi:hypothetical protein
MIVVSEDGTALVRDEPAFVGDEIALSEDDGSLLRENITVSASPVAPPRTTGTLHGAVGWSMTA